MSLAASLDHANEGTIAASERARPRIVGPGGATAAVDEQERSDAEAAEQARLAAIEAEAQLERERQAGLQDEDDDRHALAINTVAAVEAQRGRYVMTRKGAATAALVKRLLDALHDDDAPVTYPQFAAHALGGRSALPLAELRRMAAPAPAPTSRESLLPAGGEKVSAKPTDEGRRDAGSDAAATPAPAPPQAA